MIPEAEQIRDPGLAGRVVATLAARWEEPEWERIEDIPFNAKNSDTSLVTQTATRYVARASIAQAEIHRELYGTEVDTDILLAAALADDGNKFFDFYASKEGSLKPTRFRTLLPVSAYSVHK